MARKKKDTPEKADIKEAESKTGMKEAVANDDAVSLAEKPDDSKEVSMPSFFIEEDDEVVITVDILFNKKDGKLTNVSRSGLIEPSNFKTMGHCEESFIFKPIDYEQMTQYRQRCTTYRIDANRALVDPIKLRNYYIVWHLKDWTIKGKNGKKIELTFSDKGALDDDSIQKVYNMNPSMLDVVLTLFEKDALME